MIVVALIAAALVAGAPPNETVVPETKLVPEIVTGVPPRDGPVVFTESDVIVGADAAVKVNPSVFVALPPPTLVTITSTLPPACAGVVAVI